ncbi:MAG: IS1634 family transposase [Bacteroidales bacterium]|nr:IS1634 family transposase [Bacteroidales bacterium]
MHIQGVLIRNWYKRQTTKQFLDNIEHIHISGTELLLGKLYDEIGFNRIQDEYFKILVISRLIFPVSKLKTVDYLQKYRGLSVDVQALYRYLDKLHKCQKEEVQKISYEHTLKILNDEISVVFYDVTTIYFQSDNEDEIRKRGFSKDGKHQKPQIVLGLLTSAGGYPLAYEIFEGNKFEGHTMLPIIDAFKEKYQLNKLIITADSGLMSGKNISELQEKKHEFIIGARIKNETKKNKNKIFSLKLKHGESQIIKKGDTLKLIISYSDKRAKKDKYNRERGLLKLEKRVKSGKLTKSNINNRGYNKYLKLTGEINVSIDNEKFEADSKWDGLKGYLTNTNLSKGKVIENYSHLWRIEKAFRVSKHDLKIRPIYHRLQRRIEAHIIINFASYKIYKELERQLYEKKSDLSPEKAINIAKTIYSVKIRIPNSKDSITKTLILNEEQKNLADLFGF